MSTFVKNLKEIFQDQTLLPKDWKVSVVINSDNMTYFIFNQSSKEAIVFDPMREDWDALLEIIQKHEDYRFFAIVDTHTHADHVSCASRLSEHLKIPLIMHEKSPCSKVHLRVSKDLEIPLTGSSLKILTTPGHTPDGITPIWGPFLLGGDTILYGDIGRDDLPGGDPEAHYESVQKIKAHIALETILLPGHDGMGGRASSFKTQFEINPALTQDREIFVKEAAAYVGPSPKYLKESLFENLK